MDRTAWVKKLVLLLGWGFLLAGILISARDPSLLPLDVLCRILGFILLTVTRRSRDPAWFLGWGMFALDWGICCFVTSRPLRIAVGLVLCVLGLVFLLRSEKRGEALAREAGELPEDHFPW